MNLKTILTYGLVTLFIYSCKSQTSTDQQLELNLTEQFSFNTDSLLHALKYLSSDELRGRRTGEPSMEEARRLIKSKFERLGVEPLVKGYEQPFMVELKGKSYSSNNVLGVIRGTRFPDHYVVISAHYDHEGIKRGEIYNGADDNASGTAALFSFAEYLNNNPPNHSVILAAFDAEELGLLGAKHFVDNSIVPLDKIKANLNMDMISRSDSNTLWVVGTRYYEQMRTLLPVMDSIANFQLKIGHEGLDNMANWTNSSDQAVFHKKNIPFLFFTVDDHSDYHKPSDDFENIHPEFYFKSIETVISVFDKLDDLEF